MDQSKESPVSLENPHPFPRSYWARPGKLLAGCYPGADLRSHAENKLTGLLRCKISCVINLMEADETDSAGRCFVPYQPHLETLALQQGVSVPFQRFPIVDMNIPATPGMTKILDAIDSAIERSHVVYVHCWGGRGRTGTVIGCYLLRHRLVPEGGALDRITALTEHQRHEFWPTPQTTAQRQFVSDWKYGT